MWCPPWRNQPELTPENPFSRERPGRLLPRASSNRRRGATAAGPRIAGAIPAGVAGGLDLVCGRRKLQRELLRREVAPGQGHAAPARGLCATIAIATELRPGGRSRRDSRAIRWRLLALARPPGRHRRAVIWRETHDAFRRECISVRGRTTLDVMSNPVLSSSTFHQTTISGAADAAPSSCRPKTPARDNSGSRGRCLFRRAALRRVPLEVVARHTVDVKGPVAR